MECVFQGSAAYGGFAFEHGPVSGITLVGGGSGEARGYLESGKGPAGW